MRSNIHTHRRNPRATYSQTQLEAFRAEVERSGGPMTEAERRDELIGDVLSRLGGATPDDYRRFGRGMMAACEREAAENEADARMTPAEWAAWETWAEAERIAGRTADLLTYINR
jgi:hypothetical protein